MSFNELNLDPIVVRNLRAMDYREPRPIQAQAIGPILQGRDVIGLAQTGTGKTAAFLAPIVHRLLEVPPRKTPKRPIPPMQRLRSLVLCPTRELAVQVGEEARHIAANSVLRTAVAFGKVGLQPQIETLQTGIDLLVATPGRVLELLDADGVSLAHIRHVAVDEADRMLDLGFLPQVQRILQRVPERRQTLLFTATMPPAVAELAGRFLTNPVRVEAGAHTTPVGHVSQALVRVDDADKIELLLHLLRGGDRRDGQPRRGALVFCRTRRRVGWVGAALKRHDLRVGTVHGDRTQAQRLRALEQFAAGDLDVIVATDVAARGLHIAKVNVVVNYDVPILPEEYIHRIGRAAHGGGRTGESFTFLSRVDEPRWREVQRLAGVRLEPTAIAGFTLRTPEPTGDSRRRGGRAPDELLHEGDAARRERPDRRPRRPKKSRPIRKGEQPGGGVKRTRSDRE